MMLDDASSRARLKKIFICDLCRFWNDVERERYLQKIIYVKYKKHKPCGFPMPIKFAYDE